MLHYIKNIKALLLCSLAMTLASCHYKYFDDYDGMLKTKVVIDYSLMDTVSHKPEKMKVVFYSTDNAINQVRYIKDSAVIDIPSGTYKVLAYNDNNEINRFSNTYGNLPLPVIFTDKANPEGLFRLDSLDKAVYYDYPDRVFACSKIISVTGNLNTSEADDKRVVLYPEEQTRRVEVIVEGIKNQEYINGIRMSIDGIQRFYIPLAWQAENDFVPLAFDSRLHKESHTITGALNVFGFATSSHYLNVFIQGTGFKRTLRFDVTSQVSHQSHSKGPVRIFVNTDYDPYDDYPAKASGGIDVGIEDWGNEDVPVNL